MIGRLSGLLLDARPDEVLLDVSGVGYRVHIPLSTFYRLSPPPPGPIALHVHTHVREDAIQLFGFWTAAERQAFLRLIAISGIGPRLALAVLSGIGAEDLDRAVRDADRGMLERIPGIGRKTAERMLLELRDGLEPKRRGRTAREAPPAPPPASPGPDSDALSALVNLGYPEPAEASAVAAARRDLGDGAGLGQIAQHFADEEGVAVRLPGQRVGQADVGGRDGMARRGLHEGDDTRVVEALQIHPRHPRLPPQRGQRPGEWVRGGELRVSIGRDEQQSHSRVRRRHEMPQELQ